MTPRRSFDRAVINDLSESIGVVGVHRILILFIRESRAYVATIAQAVAPGSDAASHDRATSRGAFVEEQCRPGRTPCPWPRWRPAFELAARGWGGRSGAGSPPPSNTVPEDTVAALQESWPNKNGSSRPVYHSRPNYRRCQWRRRPAYAGRRFSGAWPIKQAAPCPIPPSALYIVDGLTSKIAAARVTFPPHEAKGFLDRTSFRPATTV